jgi:hypothetical protein
MFKLFLGFVLGVGVAYAFGPTEVVNTAKAKVNEAAEAVVDATEPTLKEKVEAEIARLSK